MLYYGGFNSTDPLTWTGSSPYPSRINWLPNIRLQMGSAVPITPTSTAQFVNGVWVGHITVPEEGEDICLLADGPNGRVAVSDLFHVRSSIARLKQLADGSDVYVKSVVVTAAFSGFFYVESDDRCDGIRVQKPDHGLLAGDRVDVSGTIRTNADGERYIGAVVSTVVGARED